MGLLDRVKGTAGDVVASAQDQMSKSQAKHQADEMFKVLGQAYFAHHCGRATLDEVEALAVGMRHRMVPIEEQLGPVPFPQPLPEGVPAAPTEAGAEAPSEPTPAVADTSGPVAWTEVDDPTRVAWAPQVLPPPPPPPPLPATRRQPGDDPRS